MTEHEAKDVVSTAFEIAINAMKRQEKKKPEIKEKYYFSCPECNNDLGVEMQDITVYQMDPPNYCKHCGQALDWSET